MVEPQQVNLLSNQLLETKSRPFSIPVRTTFVLPKMIRSGGPRVTVELANSLISRGYNIRLAAGKVSLSIRTLFQAMYCHLTGKAYCHWGKYYNGKIQYYRQLEDLGFLKGEIVISVGTRAIERLKKLDAEIKKVRYCHGFDTSDFELTRKVWSGTMATISVSNTLVPKLQEYSGEEVMAVIPNGVRKEQYFIEERNRDGIGMVYEEHPNKSPEDAKKLYFIIRERWPDLPVYVFSTSFRPSCISPSSYWYYPSIQKARELYNRAKIWLSPSRMEGFGLPLLEAMACGAACISTDNPGGRELIQHGINGYLVPTGQPEAFIPSIELLLNNENLRKKIVIEGLKTVDRFSWSNATDKMEDFLHKLYLNFQST